MVSTDVRQKVCIVAFSWIERDPRVLRQVHYLAREYDLTLIGYGTAPSNLPQNVAWSPVSDKSPSLWVRMLSLLLLLLGRVIPFLYDFRRWIREDYRAAYRIAIAQQHAAIHANDWITLPLARRAAKKIGAKVVFDAHEYGPLEAEQFWYWKPFMQPAAEDALRRHARYVDKMITVCQPLADRYKSDFGLNVDVIMNTPEYQAVPFHDTDPQSVRLIHHGLPMRERKLEQMIHVIAQCDSRYRLHFMLAGVNAYLEELRTLAQTIAAGRVHFHNPVATEQIVQAIADYDIGIFLLEPVNFSYRMALPNKLFEFINAGLAVCIGPSPAMATVILDHHCGWVAEDFTPTSMAKLLNQLTVEEIEQMRRSSQKAARELNAHSEMSKLVNLYRTLLDTQSPCAKT